jgi:hypothetical protein
VFNGLESQKIIPSQTKINGLSIDRGLTPGVIAGDDFNFTVGQVNKQASGAKTRCFRSSSWLIESRRHHQRNGQWSSSDYPRKVCCAVGGFTMQRAEIGESPRANPAYITAIGRQSGNPHGAAAAGRLRESEDYCAGRVPLSWAKLLATIADPSRLDLHCTHLHIS